MIYVLLFCLPIELPPLLKGEVGEPIAIKAKTTGKVVKWVVMDEGGLFIFPVELKDPHTQVVFGRKEGTYRVLAYTEGPSDPAICRVQIGSAPAPAPAPAPTPDPELKRIYDSISESNKLENLKKLEALYTQVPKFANKVSNVGELRTLLVNASQTMLPADALKPLRQKLSERLLEELPRQPSAPVTPEVIKVFEKYSKILKELQ